MNPELIYKYLENTATDDEMKQVLDWLDADPAHMRELDELDKVMAASVIYGPDVLSPAPARKAARRISLRRVPLRRIVRYAAELPAGRRISLRRITLRAAAAAAVAVILLAGGVTTVSLSKRLAQPLTVITHLGERSQVVLPDGTKVWLNAGTRLEYPLVFAGGERRVKVAGEAMFDVEHDPAHPFVVETFACDVEVLGTKFDVTAEEREGLFSAALLRGSVKVTNRLTPGEQFVLKPNEEVRLAGRRLNLNAIGSMDDYLWTEGMISIKGLSFGELMHKFEKSFGVKIRIDRNRMPEVDYNHGKIRISDGIEHALRILQRSCSFHYAYDQETSTITIY